MPRADHTPSFAVLLTALLSLSFAPQWAQAEKADRNQQMFIEADRSGKADLLGQVMVYSGNVVISQGSMLLRAERIEMRTMADGYRAATATGLAGKPATWRQRRDGVDETVEGSADRIDFDGRADTLRFVGNSAVRRLRGRHGGRRDHRRHHRLWNNLAEVFKVEGGAKTATNPTGRVRAVLSPRAEPNETTPAKPASGQPAHPQPHARGQALRAVGEMDTSPGGSRLEAEHLRKTYGQRTVVKDVHLAVGAGEVVGLLGPNGAGKTTTFYMVVGLVRADEGEIRIDGKPIQGLPIHRRSRLGLSYLPQEASIFRKLTVAENIRAVLELQQGADGKPYSSALINELLDKLLADLAIDKLRDSPAPALSAAANGGVSRSPARWPRSRVSSCWTSPLPASTRSP
jgi:lipopolysaccharide transport protein LptA